MNTKYRMRNEVLSILNGTYAPEFAARDWYQCKYEKASSYALELNMQLVVDIFTAVAFAHANHTSEKMGDYYRRTLHNEILNIIWIAWPGGSTAKSVTDDICDVLNIEKDDE